MLGMKRHINHSIKKFSLDLKGLTVFTEAATGNYSYTPIIAALAGAEKVYAIAKDSKYGTKESVRSRIHSLGNFFEVALKIEVIYEKMPEYIVDSDIVTNSGFVRPIDKNMIDAMKETAVIPLMYETWEFRHEDIDLNYCEKKNIPVLGTNECVNELNLLYGVGFLITKLLFECGMGVYKDRFLIIGSGVLGESVQTFFSRNYIETERITFDYNEKGEHVTYVKNFDIDTLKRSEYDGIIICEHIYPEPIISTDGLINQSIIKLVSDIQIIHICGNVDKNFIFQHKSKIYPTDIAPFGYMTRHTDYLGPVFTIELNTAGLKVGEIMARLRQRGLSYAQTIENANKYDLVMNFGE